ncbi:aminotransferase class I/II-fold pyridoxal phosphate-dependent enzyme [Caldalkalibacillus mannanilyticus]|uniref:aminotransferase class I/II-fold pyridoxal phosphate-dependent enzyme n=1 Tax=Caldalkalibacillus mannanilyticus TaxID=1418 RepID=UPI000B325F40
MSQVKKPFTVSENSPSWMSEIESELFSLREKELQRSLIVTEQAAETWIEREGKKLLNLASNNYLGLANREELKQGAIQAVEWYGAGSTASRLIIGNHPLYQQAEEALVQWKQAEAGLILNSGYTANIGIISALMDREGVVFSDKINHASIVDGMILSRAEIKRYRHKDLAQLEQMLSKTPITKRKLIVTDSVFSMDGDLAPLADLVRLKEKYNAILMVDEAHSSGIYGSRGEGLTHHLQLHRQIDIQMGTFSKAMGSFGAYVVGSSRLIEYLVNKMRSFIFTTALPPAVLGSILASISVVQEASMEREQLQKKARYFRQALEKLGFALCGSETQIIPILVGSNDRTMEFSRLLQTEA